MSYFEKRARNYCAEIGADPDEIVKGYWPGPQGYMYWTEMPRWCWYQ